MCPDWRGEEGGFVTDHPDALPRSAIRVRAHSEVGDDDPQKVEARFLALLEDAKGLQARGRDVQERIMTLAETGKLVTATAPRDGGELKVVPRDKGYWNLNQPRWRFLFCMMSWQEPGRPPHRYRPGLPYSSEFHWVYVENTSLDRVLGTRSLQSAEASVAEAEVANVLAEEGSVEEEIGYAAQFPAVHEKKAISLVAASLRSNKDLTREEAMKAIVAADLRVSGNRFQSEVWPKARVEAGLDKRANAGRKPAAESSRNRRP